MIGYMYQTDNTVWKLTKAILRLMALPLKATYKARKKKSKTIISFILITFLSACQSEPAVRKVDIAFIYIDSMREQECQSTFIQMDIQSLIPDYRSELRTNEHVNFIFNDAFIYALKQKNLQTEATLCLKYNYLCQRGAAFYFKAHAVLITMDDGFAKEEVSNALENYRFSYKSFKEKN